MECLGHGFLWTIPIESPELALWKMTWVVRRHLSRGKGRLKTRKSAGVKTWESEQGAWPVARLGCQRFVMRLPGDPVGWGEPFCRQSYHECC